MAQYPSHTVRGGRGTLSIHVREVGSMEQFGLTPAIVMAQHPSHTVRERRGTLSVHVQVAALAGCKQHDLFHTAGLANEVVLPVLRAIGAHSRVRKKTISIFNKKGRKCALAHTARTVRGDIDQRKVES